MADINRIRQRKRNVDKNYALRATKIFDLTGSGDIGVTLISERRVTNNSAESETFSLKRQANASPWKEDQTNRKVRSSSSSTRNNDPTAALRRFVNNITRR
jgi:hypothetical protein